MRFAIGLSVLLVGFSVFYYLVIFLPQKNQQQVEQKLNTETVKILNKASNQDNLESCLDNVKQRFSKVLEEQPPKTNEGVKIMIDIVKEAKSECYKKYPQ